MDRLVGIVWGEMVLIPLLALVGIYLTVGLRAMPWRYLGYAVALLWRREPGETQGEISPFQALMTALSATIGTGNIAGVATAIYLGGPGAVFWMWVIALFGMATKYAEALLAVKFREVDATGQYVGGPMYYIENQSGVNPHDELGYEESARIILDHVIKGIELARRYKLPDEVTDFIRTHHGTTRTEYFYRMKIKELGDESLVNPEDYTYPGPLPYSKETAVLMMADSVEAASRSLKEYNAESIDKLVEGIIGHQLNLQQFINADITLKDITKIKKMFKRKLMNIYHVRVEYPK